MAIDENPVPIYAVEIVNAVLKGNRIKEVLIRLGISQEEAARRAGVSYRHFNRVVLGDSEPSFLVACRLEAVLGEPIEALFDMEFTIRRTVVPVRK